MTQVPKYDEPKHPLADKVKEAILKDQIKDAKVDAIKDALTSPKTFTRKDELLKQLEQILTECGGESNVGMTNDYWVLLREYRSLP